jgi:hypothetical protein
MPQKKLIILFSLFAAMLILSSTYFMMERDRMNITKIADASLDMSETEGKVNSNIQEEIKEEIKHLNPFDFDIFYFTASVAQHLPYVIEIPIIPHIEKPTPPPNVF